MRTIMHWYRFISATLRRNFLMEHKQGKIEWKDGDCRMKTLIVNRDGVLEMREVPKPAYEPGQALVKVLACGICNGTDGKLIHQAFKGVGKEQYPLMLGHEAVGEVVEVGSEVKGYQRGDKVLLPFVDPDPDNYPGLGSAWGGFSEYAVVCDKLAYPEGEVPECAYAQTILPDDIDPVDAVMIITLREVLSSIRRFGIEKGSSVAVFGCGPVGLTFMKLMKLMGAGPVIAFDIIEEKLQEAKEKGADYVFHSQKVSPKEEVRKICPDGVDFVLDAVGILSIINQAMTLIKDGGKISCYGISPEMSAQIDWSEAPYNWQLHFQQFPSKAEEGACDGEIVRWIQEGKICLKDFISDYFSFQDYAEAFEKLSKKQIAKKGIIVF